MVKKKKSPSSKPRRAKQAARAKPIKGPMAAPAVQISARGRAAGAAAAPGVPVPTIVSVTVPAGGTLIVIVDVGPMTVPYTVSYNGRTVLKGLVDAAGAVPLVPGRQVLGWAFVHAAPGWHHTIAYAVDDAEPVVLESKSAARNDEAQGVGFAFVQA